MQDTHIDRSDQHPIPEAARRLDDTTHRIYRNQSSPYHHHTDFYKDNTIVQDLWTNLRQVAQEFP